MNAQTAIMESRVVHVRELKAEIERLRNENLRLRDENASLSRHMALAVLAADDMRRLPPDGRFVIVDGWNLILGSRREAHTQDELVGQVRRRLALRPSDFAWIVFDGPTERSSEEDRLRISYTGGNGPHRADRMICDFLRMAKLSDNLDRVVVRTDDGDFAKEARRISGRRDIVLQGWQ